MAKLPLSFSPAAVKRKRTAVAGTLSMVNFSAPAGWRKVITPSAKVPASGRTEAGSAPSAKV